MNTGLIGLSVSAGKRGDPAVTAEIQTAVVSRRNQRGEHREWALLCEQAGLLSLAFSEFQLALRDDPQDPLAAFHLAQHYRERGDTTRALGLLERLLAGARPKRRGWKPTWKSWSRTGPNRVPNRPSRGPNSMGWPTSRPPPCAAPWANGRPPP